MPGLILLCLLNLLLFSVNYPGFEINFFSWQTILTHVFTFRTNLLFPDRTFHLWAWSILWSLAIEEVFYLFFPIICVLLRSPKKIIIFLVCIIFYGPYCRLHAQSAFGSVRLYFGCFDLIAFGCLAALLSQTTQTKLFIKKSTQRFHPKMWIATGTILMVGMYFIGPWTLNNVCGPTIIALGCFLYLIGVTYNQSEKTPETKSKQSRLSRFCKKLVLPFCLLGLLSYELYLYHVMIFLLFKPLITWMGAKVGWTWFFSNTWMFGLEVLTGILGWFWLFHFINPFRKKLVERFSPRLDFFTFVMVPHFFHALSQQCNFIYHRLRHARNEKTLELTANETYN
jgi:peptidoglycan/LPS O-acetylase OafA/YrhL